MNAVIRQIPNCITCLNILSGCVAVSCAWRGAEPLWGLSGFEWAYIFIGIAAVADFLDGFAARLLHAYSNVGKELDSLCDLVSFGVAPAMILLNALSALGAGSLAWGALLIPVACALRLARFNIDTRQSVTFIGLPVPANAIFWIGYVALALSGVSFLTLWYVFIPVLLLECWLMLSPVRIISLKFHSWGWRGNASRWLLIAAAPVCVFCLGVGGLLWLIVFYVLLSLAVRPS